MFGDGAVHARTGPVVTAVDDVRDLGAMRSASERAYLLAKAECDAAVEDLEFWKDKAHMAEQERDELDRRLRDSEVRRVELEGLYAREVAAAATARAQAEALKGNR